MPLTQETRDKIEAAMQAVNAEGWTFCGAAVLNEEVQPFSNLPSTAEFVFNSISMAGVVAESIGADVSAIEAAQAHFQKQYIKINEA